MLLAICNLKAPSHLTPPPHPERRPAPLQITANWTSVLPAQCDHHDKFHTCCLKGNQNGPRLIYLQSLTVRIPRAKRASVHIEFNAVVIHSALAQDSEYWKTVFRIPPETFVAFSLPIDLPWLSRLQYYWLPDALFPECKVAGVWNRPPFSITLQRLTKRLLFRYLYRASFIILYNDEPMHNYLTARHTLRLNSYRASTKAASTYRLYVQPPHRRTSWEL
jgi:hypothetical protein